ncbi:hypothetical protein ACFUJ0_35040, partial [Streptomyces sp. NPDC057242]
TGDEADENPRDDAHDASPTCSYKVCVNTAYARSQGLQTCRSSTSACTPTEKAAAPLLADGSEIFDLWRLRWYGLSLPEPLDVTDQDLRTAVRSLRPLLTEVRPGWLSVAG